MKKILTKMIMLASVFGVAVVLAGCSCPNKHQMHHGQYAQCNKKDHSRCNHNKQNMQSSQISETVVFYQTYEGADIDNVHAKMYTRSSRGGESAMGTIKFKETDAGLKMKVDLVDLRPGKTYTAHVYQCGMCNDWSCCNKMPMAVDLPQLMINKPGRLETSYIIRGLTAAQLNNGKLVLTRDGGYKAAWGTLKQ